MFDKAVQIPYSLCSRIVDHLAAHAGTDEWASVLLEELEKEKQIVTIDENELKKQEAKNRFEKHFGELNLGYELGTNNEAIDEDLARSYLDVHE